MKHPNNSASNARAPPSVAPLRASHCLVQTWKLFPWGPQLWSQKPLVLIVGFPKSQVNFNTKVFQSTATFHAPGPKTTEEHPRGSTLGKVKVKIVKAEHLKKLGVPGTIAISKLPGTSSWKLQSLWFPTVRLEHSSTLSVRLSSFSESYPWPHSQPKVHVQKMAKN